MRRLFLIVLLCSNFGCLTILFGRYERCQKRHDEKHGAEVSFCQTARDRIQECREGLATQAAPYRPDYEGIDNDTNLPAIVQIVNLFLQLVDPPEALTPEEQEERVNQDRLDVEQDERHDNEFRIHCSHLVREAAQACDHPADECGPRPLDF